MTVSVYRKALIISAVLLCFIAIKVKAGGREHLIDGGMMLHTGFLSGDIGSLNYHASGMPFGIGGVIHLHIGQHFRIGGEGYVSTLHQMGNGSYIRYGWGGLLGDFYWSFKRLMPYIGLSIGGGSNKDFLMIDTPDEEYRIVGEAYYRKKGFMFIDPFIGCDFILSNKIHLTLKTDFLLPIGKELQIPTGPRFYFGILFYH